MAAVVNPEEDVTNTSPVIDTVTWIGGLFLLVGIIVLLALSWSQHPSRALKAVAVCVYIPSYSLFLIYWIIAARGFSWFKVVPFIYFVAYYIIYSWGIIVLLPGKPKA